MRLTVESVDRASAAVKRPQYARTEVTPGIVHLADAAMRIVSLTVTEKGYCYNAASGGLDVAHPQ